MIQGGDIINFNGTSGESIYGIKFEDEHFGLTHSSGGLLSMVNEGYPNSNSSQFIITISATSHLDNTNVVFGKVLKGMGVVLEVSQIRTVNDIPVEVNKYFILFYWVLFILLFNFLYLNLIIINSMNIFYRKYI